MISSSTSLSTFAASLPSLIISRSLFLGFHALVGSFILAESTIAACDCTVRIPMTHGVDSLNVAAASAVAFYQLALLAGLSETED